jgi:lactobin A/cerein 7B family class IIb bacteriocin
MDPKAQDGSDALTDELTDEQVVQVSGGLAKIGVGVTILQGPLHADGLARGAPARRCSESTGCGSYV